MYCRFLHLASYEPYHHQLVINNNAVPSKINKDVSMVQKEEKHNKNNDGDNIMIKSTNNNSSSHSILGRRSFLNAFGDNNSGHRISQHQLLAKKAKILKLFKNVL